MDNVYYVSIIVVSTKDVVNNFDIVFAAITAVVFVKSSAIILCLSVTSLYV